ncbi:MAG: DUF262 domain-containing protein [Dehalococcoidia bacterium]|nr:DUF262 domain-containing protein [Dehalococcoidia bacterium]
MFQPTQYPISDLYDWIKGETLILQPAFQRGDTWQLSAQSFFIDTLLRDLPIPPIYIRLKTDRETKTSYREVVDGQQRLSTIVKFIDGQLTLDRRSKEFAGKKYDTLDDADQARFLKYQVGVQQLYDADDDTVLDIFHRINAYGISLNRQELRHGKFQGGKYKGTFRWAVIRLAERWEALWSQYRVVTVRNRVRLLHHELVAQMLGILLEGVTDGGQPKIDKLYQRYDSELPEHCEEEFDKVCTFIVEHFSDVLNTKLGSGPHFLMVFAAVAHALLEIPDGDMKGEYPSPPERTELALSDPAVAMQNLLLLADVFDMSADEVPERLKNFKISIAGTTQRIKSRSERFLTIYRALLPEPV